MSPIAGSFRLLFSSPLLVTNDSSFVCSLSPECLRESMEGICELLQAHCAWCLQDTLRVLSGAGSPLFSLHHAVVWSQDSARASFVSSVFPGSPPSNPGSSCPTVCRDNVVSIGTHWPLPTCCLVNPSPASAAARPSRSDPGLPTAVCAVTGALLRLAHPHFAGAVRPMQTTFYTLNSARVSPAYPPKLS